MSWNPVVFMFTPSKRKAVAATKFEVPLCSKPLRWPHRPVVAKEQMLDENEDDSPEVTDPSLTAPGCAYQLAIAATYAGTFRQFDNGMRHVAMRDIIASNDPAAPDAFGYLCGAGVPRLSRVGEEPYAVLAARRHDHPSYRSLLVTLASYGYDFNAPSITAPHETAKSIIEARAPGTFASIQQDGWRSYHAL